MPSMRELKKKADELRAIAARAIEAARSAKVEDAVNWGDLRVDEISYSFDRDYLEVTISEAAPEAREFCEFIWDWIYKHGFRYGEHGASFSIRTEW